MGAEKRSTGGSARQSTAAAAAAASSSKSKPASSSSSSSAAAAATSDDAADMRLFFPSSKLKLLHQRTSLSLAYDRARGWGYRGETAMYVIVDPDDNNGTAGGGMGAGPSQQRNDDGKGGGGGSTTTTTTTSTSSPSTGGGGGMDGGRPIELALHLRNGCRVESAEVYVPTATGGLRRPHRRSVSFAHHDPLSVVMTRPAGSMVSPTNEENEKEGDGGGDDAKKKGKMANDAATSTTTRRRYDADAHATRGTKGMTYSIRAASISSAVGELRIRVSAVAADDRGDDARPPRSEEEAKRCWTDDLLSSRVGETPRGDAERDAESDALLPRCRTRREGRCASVAAALARATPTVVGDEDGDDAKKKKKDVKKERPPPSSLSRAMKIAVRFSLRAPASSTNGATHLGGITLVAPRPPPPPPSSSSERRRRRPPPSLSTPHAHTVSGTHGDHQGCRSWLPTLDSASPHHRASHELVVKATAREEEGLWAAGAGEDAGANVGVRHPVLGNDGAKERVFGPMRREGRGGANGGDDGNGGGREEAERAWDAVRDGVAGALGVRHAGFVDDFFYGTEGDGDDDEDDDREDDDDGDAVMSNAEAGPSSATPALAPDRPLNSEMISRIRHDLRPSYVTSIFSSLVWSPCPSRSLGFAVGPFATLYDPEYFRADEDDSDDDGDGAEDEMAALDDNGVYGEDAQSSARETATRTGEGVRQLYFAPPSDRGRIHADASDESVFGRPPLSDCAADDGLRRRQERRRHRGQRRDPTAAELRERRLLERSVLASTIGVPNRALSLARDVLALPAYRTASYTQIWIPDARSSGGGGGGNPGGRPEAEGCNPFLGGAVLDGTLLPPPGMRLPFHDGGGGRTLQFLQARCAIRGWTRAALPLGGDDDVGQGYLHVLVEAFLMSLYERGHGAFGEGGGRGSFFYTKRYAIGSGLNSPNLDFLPLVNIEDDEVVGGGIGVAIEERGKEHLWRSSNNGTETHTSSLDEYVISQLQAKDFIEAMERDRACPTPSMGWMGSHQCATFLTHNSASSSQLGCGALDLVHPAGGQVYRAVKAVLLERVYEGRAGISHLTRVVRAAFMASFLRDSGVEQLELPQEEEKGGGGEGAGGQDKDAPPMAAARPPFVVCIDEIIKKQALSHAIFTRALRVMAGPIHEAYLRGNLVDIGRENLDSRKCRLVAPEGFPNSYVRGASGLFMRVGVYIEAADGSSSGAPSASAASQSAAAVKGIHLHVVVEPVVPEGGSVFGGPVTLRVIENEGQCREFIKNIPEDGSRAEWGPVFLHARPVSTAKQQQAASGISEAPTATAAGSAAAGSGAIAGGKGGTAFTADHLHRGGFQALELIRITNQTPLLWVRVDPHGLYNGRLNIFQQDACLAEQLFHDGDAAGQVEAMRALAERPLKIQGTPKINNVHDVPIAELPVRVLGDCLRGSVALHCDLPHNPAVRAQAALAIAQWQNNKAPESRDVVGGGAWLGLDLLLQYFRERYYCNGVVLPINFRRLVLHKHIAGGAGGGDTTSDGGYQYLDALADKDERKQAIVFADEVEIEEDEEYRVRSACVTGIASVRAQDGMTPKSVVTFLEEVLLSGDKAAVGSLLLPHEEELVKKKQDQALNDEVAFGRRIIGPNDQDVSNLPYVSLSLVADALLALCYVHVRPQSDFDPTTAAGRPVNLKVGDHPILPLMTLALEWLDWDLERMRLRAESSEATSTGVGDACYATIAPCAITAICHMGLLKQSTTFSLAADKACSQTASVDDSPVIGLKRKPEDNELEKTTTAQFYIDIFDDNWVRADAIRAAAAQSVVCICCAADRNEESNKEPLGLLVSLEFMLDRILESTTSPGLRLTLALLMMDASTGKICSLQRVGSFCGRNNLCASGTRFMNGPLGASAGGDNGSSLLLTITDSTYPAANAVNDGARRGLRMLKDNCKSNDYNTQTVVRVAKFATRLWRTINGELTSPPVEGSPWESVGVCAHDNHLRCALVALWQWIWPRQCWQILRAQPLHALEEKPATKPQYYSMGLNHVMKATAEEKDAAAMEDEALKPLARVVEAEIDRQKWRGDMAGEAYKYFRSSNKNVNLTEAGQTLPVVEKDTAWKLGGWVASTAHQRRNQGADGGSAVSKIRLNVKSSSSGGENS